MYTKTITAMSQALAAGEISSVDLMRHFLGRIQKFNPSLNAVITLTEDEAMAQAEAADSLIASGKAGPLTGIPLLHKDLFCTEGVRTTCASRMLDNFISPYDATVVKRMREAGMVMLGKANMDEFAMGSSNETSHYGSVRNPWDTDRIPGGSSGGSAAAVAGRLIPAATASDTGGSIRQPAAMCGVTGIKPTYGRVSRWGMVAFASSLDQGGPIAASAEDCALLLGAMAGFDPHDSTSIDHPIPDYTATLGDDLDGLRIGLPKEFFGEGLNPAVAKVIEAAMDVFRGLGVEFREISLPNTHLAVPAYYVVAPAECSSNLSRFDGVRFGHRCQSPGGLSDLYERSRGEGFGEEVKRRIMVGTYALSAGYYDAYYLKAQKIRRLISDDYRRAFESVDLILGPTSPTTAFRIGEKTDDPVSMYLSDIYTIAVNLAGLPGMSVPAGFADGLPVGLQIVGNYFDEGRMLNAAHRFQQETDWHTRIPPGFA